MSETNASPSEISGLRLWWIVFSAGVLGGTVGCFVFIALVMAAFLMGRLPD